MKVIWEPNDIKAGKVYAKSETGEKWMIGYLSWKGDADKYVSISLLDGWVTTANSQSALAEKLTEDGYLPIELLSPPKEG